MALYKTIVKTFNNFKYNNINLITIIFLILIIIIIITKKTFIAPKYKCSDNALSCKKLMLNI